MPGVDFSSVRAQISLAQVLRLLDFVPTRKVADQLRGPCPVHGSRRPGSRSFSANVAKNVYHCFKCGSAGNQLDLWMAVHDVNAYRAAVDLCERLSVQVPWLE
jgi:DNA primase